MIFSKLIFDAIEEKKDIKIGDRIIHITPKFTKRDFLNSLNDLGTKSEQEYFELFGVTPISLEMYPTIKGIKEEFGVSYKELSNIGKIDLCKRVGHTSIDTTLKYYNKSKKEKDEKVWKEAPSLDYLEFMIWFGDNKELYNKLKSFKEDSKCSWEKIKELKYRDIDLENNTINIETDEIDIC